MTWGYVSFLKIVFMDYKYAQIDNIDIVFRMMQRFEVASVYLRRIEMQSV